MQNLEGYGIQWLTLGTAYRYAAYQFSVDVCIPYRQSKRQSCTSVPSGISFPVVPIRLGFSNGAFTAGIGVAWKGIHIDYARIFEKTFRIGFHWNSN